MDNSTWMSEGSSVANAIQGSKLNISKLKLMLNITHMLIALIAIIGNSVALRVITCSADIRSCKSYILFINQCLLDGGFGVFTIFCVIVEYTLKNTNMKHNALDGFICSILHSDVLMAIVSCGAAYNLGAMSVERMISIVFPVFHRTRVTDHVIIGIGVLSWVLGMIVMIPLCIISNGVDPNGNCYYWNGFPDYRLTISIMLNSYLSVIPFMIMLIAFVAMFVRIKTMKLNVRMAVIKVLASCVFMFFMFHALRNAFSVLSLVTNKGILWFRDPVYIIALLLIQCTSIINPIVYVVQYKDYRKELVRQVHQVMNFISGKASNEVEPETTTCNSSSVNTSVNEKSTF